MKCYAMFVGEKCVQVICCDALMSPSSVGGAVCYEIESLCDAQDVYLKNGEVHKKPLQPDSAHKWDEQALEWVPDQALACQTVKSQRQGLLQQSDWTQLPDVPIATKEAWATYRQALRDITNQPGYPLEVVWPTPPV